MQISSPTFFVLQAEKKDKRMDMDAMNSAHFQNLKNCPIYISCVGRNIMNFDLKYYR